MSPHPEEPPKAASRRVRPSILDLTPQRDVGRLGEKIGRDRAERIDMGRGEMGVEIGLAHPVLMENEEPGIVRRDVQVVIEATLLAAGRRADGKERPRAKPPPCRAWYGGRRSR